MSLNAGMPIPEIFVSLYGEERARQIKGLTQNFAASIKYKSFHVETYQLHHKINNM